MRARLVKSIVILAVFGVAAFALQLFIGRTEVNTRILAPIPVAAAAYQDARLELDIRCPPSERAVDQGYDCYRDRNNFPDRKISDFAYDLGENKVTYEYDWQRFGIKVAVLVLIVAALLGVVFVWTSSSKTVSKS